MATGTIRDGVNNVRTLKLAHTAAVVRDEVIVSNGQVLVACNAKDADTDNVYAYRGRVELPKEADLAIDEGDVCYWVAASGNINKTSGGNTKAGICVEKALAADTTVLVMLDENK